MPGWKRVLTILLVVLGPGAVIYFLATHLQNKFIELPYLGGWNYEYNANGLAIDSTAFRIPDFSLTKFDGSVINRDSIEGKFIVLTTIQPQCPELYECGMGMYNFEQIFFKKLMKNQKNYSNVKVLSILTDREGNAIYEGPPSRIKEEMDAYNTDIWWSAYGDPTPLFSWEYYGKNLMKQESEASAGEIGPLAFINALVLIDQEGHIRGVTGAKRDSDIRNFFDMLKLLKKEDFDQKWAEKYPKD